MELSVREWIMVGSVAVIAVILGHALWVRWRASRSNLRLEIDPAAKATATAVGEVDDLDLLRGELPNGGARVVTDATAAPRARNKLSAKGGARDAATAVASARDSASVPPVLLDTVSGGKRVEPRLDEDAEEFPQDTDVAIAPRGTVAATGDNESSQPSGAVRGPTDGARSRPPPERAGSERDNSDRASADREQLIVMQVLARDADGFEVAQLMNRATQAGMKFGDFNIFHRYKDGRPARKGIEYSMANAVEPGVFDLSTGAAGRTRGVAFFMQLPTPSEPMDVFDDMLRVAQDIAGGLGGELRDERHGPMTVQTIEHCRERIREFTRRQQLPG